MKASFQNKLTD